jgi:TPR repeat protein
VVSLDGLLAAAADAIGRMPEADYAVRLSDIEAEHRRRQRDDLARARQAAFLDSLELERAAYELGRRNDHDGNLDEAARWYGVAARHDHADAALRLGEVLDLLAERSARRAAPAAEREEYRLVTEAATAYAEAYGAGYPEAADKIDEMLEAVARRRQGTPGRPLPTGGPERRDDCSYVRDFQPENDVLREEEIQRLSHHAAQCMSCLEEFIGLVKAATA